MLSISARGSAGEAVSYYEHLAHDDDYYTRGGEPPGAWMGLQAQRLGLAGHVGAEDFRALAEGRAPDDGRDLVQKAGPRHRAGWDLTFSCPKSVSSVWAVAQGEQRDAIESAHREAVAEALGFIEREAAYTRRGKGSTTKERLNGLIGARYDHHTSRAQDPQLHSHLFIFNVAERDDGSWGAIESSHFYDWKLAAGGIYRVALAERLRQLGYETEADTQSFRIKAVPRDVENEFSQRRRQIEQAAKEHGYTSAAGMEQAALRTRAKKQTVSHDALREDWVARAAAHGLTPESAQEMVRAPAQPASEIDYHAILAELTKDQSVFERQDAVCAVAVAVQTAGGDIGRVMRETDAIMQSAEIVQLQNGLMTTREMLEVERGASERAGRLDAASSHEVSATSIEAAFAARPTITDEQKRTIEHMLSPGALKLVKGEAGTGKSYSCDAAREVWEASGYRVIGAALAGKAAKGLEQSAKIDSQTLHSLLYELERGRTTLDAKSVIVVDEAGMIGSRHMAQLLEQVERAGAKLVLVGDYDQLQPVAAAGGIFRYLARQLGFAELTQIVRQQGQFKEEERRMVQSFARGKAREGLAWLESQGRLHESPDRRLLMSKMVDSFVSERDHARPGESLMFASTRQDTRLVNDLARDELRRRGLIAATDCQYAGELYAVGDRVLLTRNSKLLGVDVSNGDLGTVIEAMDGCLVVQLDNGNTRELREHEYEHVQHGYCLTVHKGQGVTCDKAYVLMHEGMSSKEMSYVAASRHRYSLNMYSDMERERLVRVMSRSAAKYTALDYLNAEPEAQVERKSVTQRVQDFWNRVKVGLGHRDDGGSDGGGVRNDGGDHSSNDAVPVPQSPATTPTPTPASTSTPVPEL